VCAVINAEYLIQQQLNNKILLLKKTLNSLVIFVISISKTKKEKKMKVKQKKTGLMKKREDNAIRF
jgi:hypothetical protein